MIKIIISEPGQKELSRLNYDIEAPLKMVLEFAPRTDIVALEQIYITDSPEQWCKHLVNARGAYYEKQDHRQAYIELFVKNIFKHIKNPRSLQMMVPIQNICIAETVYHEIGHHVERTKGHGIKAKKREAYAKAYANNLLYDYLLNNAASINACFDNLEKIAGDQGLSKDIIRNMRVGWERQYETAENNLKARSHITTASTADA